MFLLYLTSALDLDLYILLEACTSARASTHTSLTMPEEAHPHYAHWHDQGPALSGQASPEATLAGTAPLRPKVTGAVMKFPFNAFSNAR